MKKYFYICETKDRNHSDYRFRSSFFESLDDCESECFKRFKYSWLMDLEYIKISVYSYNTQLSRQSLHPVMQFYYCDHR